MNKHAMAIAALALALCLLLAGCGGQGALPVSPDALGETAQNGKAKEPQAEETGGMRGGEAEQPQENDGPQAVEPGRPQENTAPRSAETKEAPRSADAENPQENTAPRNTKAEDPQENTAARGAEARKPQENTAPRNTKAEDPQENTAARSAETKEAPRSGEAKKWQAITIDAAGFGIPDKPIGDPALYGGAASLPLGKLMACSLSGDGAAGEDLSDELWRRFLEDPETVLAFLALMGDQRDEYWECPAADEICRTIACADGAWYNSVEFGEALAACRERYPAGGRATELLDLLEEEHAASLERNGWQGAEPKPLKENTAARSAETKKWRAVSVDLADYGLTRTLEDPRFEYIFNHTDTVPLDQLIVFDLWGDALTEGSNEELRNRFLEDPDTVLAYLVLMGDQLDDYWKLPAAEIVCRRIASADAAWHGGSEEFARTLAACRERYSSGRTSKLLDVLEREHAASLERNRLLA